MEKGYATWPGQLILVMAPGEKQNIRSGAPDRIEPATFGSEADALSTELQARGAGMIPPAVDRAGAPAGRTHRGAGSELEAVALVAAFGVRSSTP